MRVRVDNPRALDSLTAALVDAGCIVARTSRDALEVGARWQLDGGDAVGQAELELRFFLRAWEGLHPGVSAELVT